jgi:hypothetical protein
MKLIASKLFKIPSLFKVAILKNGILEMEIIHLHNGDTPSK